MMYCFQAIELKNTWKVLHAMRCLQPRLFKFRELMSCVMCCLQAIQASTTLDGQAVVVMFRALCAVSREELERAQPRVYCLEELVACAWNNIGAWVCVCALVLACLEIYTYF